ncbi:myosin light chain kinase, smooth muscle-like [Pygocentrus nattereri]|uniref:myosin light chain kinase, smooth muscle-like n=1 Tax=Pygocentrus nattereri TaxID=42514 RepID=UPI00081478EE|nr:myosin light chain kinase, smooth muscle-like [Pygocentrus nattereri]
MGSSQTKPEFVSYLVDQNVAAGQDVTLRCEANTGEVTAKWEKNGRSLESMGSKYTTRQCGATFTLIIRNITKQDEGKYTISLWNEAGSASCSAMVTVDMRFMLASAQGHLMRPYL